MIYFNEQSEELLGEVEGKGTLINSLILEHFSNDEEHIRRKIEHLEQQFNAETAKLNLKVEQRQRKAAEAMEVKKESIDEIEHKAAVTAWKFKLENGEITMEEYMKGFDKKTGKFIRVEEERIKGL